MIVRLYLRWVVVVVYLGFKFFVIGIIGLWVDGPHVMTIYL